MGLHLVGVLGAAPPPATHPIEAELAAKEEAKTRTLDKKAIKTVKLLNHTDEADVSFWKIGVLETQSISIKYLHL